MVKTVIDHGVLKSFRDYHQKHYQGMQQNAATSVGVFRASIDYQTLVGTPHIYTNELPLGAVTDQKRSGRCWMFAALNMLKVNFLKETNLKDFNFSHAYLYFYDRLERANAYLDSVIDLAKEDLEDRLVNAVVFYPMEDGGWWQRFTSLIEKYGMVPEYAYPDAANVEFTDLLQSMLQKRLRRAAKDIREAKLKKERVKIKDQCMEDVYQICAISLGIPPKTFDLILKDKDDKLIEKRQMTPMDFYKEYLKDELKDYYCLSNYPTAWAKENTHYVREFSKMPQEGQVNFVNVSLERLKEVARNMVKDDKAIWFAADVGKDSLISRDGKNNGTLAYNLINRDALFNKSTVMSKGDELTVNQSGPTHAMVFVGYDDKASEPRWKVENSWSAKSGQKGYLVMNDPWFDQYVFEVVAKKSYLNEKELKAFDQEPIAVKPWEIIARNEEEK